MGILWNISQILNYNFIATLTEKIPIPFETQATIALKINSPKMKPISKN
jgi:hypothetical protein